MKTFKGQKLIYISHWRVPSEKTMSPLIMKTCEGLADSGFDVELWLPERKDRLFTGIDPFSYHGVRNVFKIKKIVSINLLSFLPNKLAFCLLVVSYNFSVLFHAFFGRVLRSAIFYGHDTRDGLLILLFGATVFFEIHDFYKSSFNFINKLGFGSAKGLIVTNSYKIELINRQYNVPINKMILQPNAVDIAKFSIDIDKEDARKKLKLSTVKKIALYTGHLFDWKGVYTLLESAKYLNDNWIVYFVGGTNEDVFNLKEKRNNFGINEDKVKIIGRKPHDEMPFWQKAADVLVLPNTAKVETSKFETSPVKLFEYMASGVPIVASDLPSIRQVVNENMVWFFEADNPKSLAQKIVEAEENLDESLKKTKNVIVEVGKYSWQNRANNIKKFVLF